MSPNPDAELLARCRNGDAQAWDELFDLHYAPTGRFIFQLLPDLTREDAEEICQETFLAVINNLGSFQGASRLQTWIFRIAANKTRDYRQRQNAAKRGGGHTPLSLQADVPETDLPLDPPSPGPAPDAVLISSEHAAQVALAIERVGEPCREIIELRFFGDLSYEEIATDLRLNPKTVSSRLSKCLDRLESILDPMLSGSDPAGFPV